MTDPNRHVGPTGDAGFSLVEVMVALLLFTIVFLIIFGLLGQLLIRFSGSDALRAAQIADEFLAEFQDSGAHPDENQIVIADSIRYRVGVEFHEDDALMKLKIAVIRETTEDTIGVYYSERYDVRK